MVGSIHSYLYAYIAGARQVERRSCRMTVRPVSLTRSSCGRDSLGEWLAWVNINFASSMLYVCFGTQSQFGSDQHDETAAGLQDSGHVRVWVVRNSGEWKPPAALENRLMIEMNSHNGLSLRKEDRSKLVRLHAPHHMLA